VYTVIGGAINVDGELYPVSLKDGNYIIRKLSIDECKLLQNIPDWYEFPVSDTQAYRMLGNGWTIGVISHLLKATQSYIQ
jgi:DNA (cytosine-5)-methyltransferase 3A